MKIFNKFLISILTCFLFAMSVGAEEPLVEDTEAPLVYNAEEGTSENPENVVEGTTEGVVEGDGETVIDSSEPTSEGIASTENEVDTSPEENSSVESLPELATFEKEIVYNEEHTIATVILTYTGECTELNIANADEIQEFVNIGVYKVNMEKGDWETSIAFDILLNGMVYFDINVWNNDDLIGTVPVRCSITGLNNDQLIFDPNQEPTTYEITSSDVGSTDSRNMTLSYETNVSFTWSIPTELTMESVEDELSVTVNNSNLASETILRIRLDSNNDFKLINNEVDDPLSYVIENTNSDRVKANDAILDHMYNVETTTNTLKFRLTKSPIYAGTFSDTLTFTASIERLLEDIYNGQQFTINNLGQSHELNNLFIYGVSQQDQYEGKNLLNDILETQMQNGVTCTQNLGPDGQPDGTYTLNGTATDWVYFIFKDITMDKPFRLVGCPGGNLAKTYFLQIRNTTDGSYINDVGNGITININEETTFSSFAIAIRKDTVCKNLVFKPMLTTDLNANYDDYEPYVGGIPAPTPENPSEIQSVVNPSIKLTGKNLLNFGNFSNEHVDGIGYFNYQLRNGDTNANIIVGKVQNDGKHNITFTPKEDIERLFLRHSGITKDFTIFHEKVNLKANTTYTLSFVVDGYNPSSVGSLNISNFQLEEGSSATEYETYKENQATLSYVLNAIPVSSGGNVTVNGQQYISDYIDIENKKLVRMVGDVELSNFSYGTYSNFKYTDIPNIKYASSIADKGNALCEKYKLRTATGITSADNYEFAISTTDIRITMPLDETPSGKMIYELETPTEESLTDAEVQAFKDLYTYSPTTVVSCSSDQLTPYIEFSLS